MRAIAEKENNGRRFQHKEDTAKLIAYFAEVLPDYDEDRVYASDIKKVLNWYNMLQAKKVWFLRKLPKQKSSR
jgi:hypothetical protein